MNKRELIEQLGIRREALGLTHADVAERSGLTERSVRNALGERANPQLSSLLALVDALGLELQLAPRGFGGVAPAPEGYRPVTTRIARALARPASGDTSPAEPPTGAAR